MTNANFEENFGRIGTDIITGFTGIITGVTLYVYGCEQYCIIPKITKDGKRQDCEWFDVSRIKVSGKKISLENIENVKGAEIPSEKLPAE